MAPLTAARKYTRPPEKSKYRTWKKRFAYLACLISIYSRPWHIRSQISHARHRTCTRIELASLNTVGIKTSSATNTCLRRLVRELLKLQLPFPVIISVEEDSVDQQLLWHRYSIPKNIAADFTFVPIGRDGGLSKGRNALVSHIRTPFLTLLDDDFTFTTDVSTSVLLREVCFLLRLLQKREFDLIGGCTLRPCLAYKL